MRLSFTITKNFVQLARTFTGSRWLIWLSVEDENPHYALVATSIGFGDGTQKVRSIASFVGKMGTCIVELGGGPGD